MKEKPIICDPAIKLGRPVFVGTRIAVDEILDSLATGSSVEQVLERWPQLREEKVLEALRFAAEAVRGNSPIESKPPHELHGAHAVEVPGGPNGATQHAIAVRTYQPEAVEVAIRRLPAAPEDGKAWIPALDPRAAGDSAEAPTLYPMERVHPAGVFEALFIGETTPFFYELEVTARDGVTRTTATPYGLPPSIGGADLPQFVEATEGETWHSQTTMPASRLHDKLGAHVVEHAGTRGVAFAVWAPHAASVSVIGDFNQWSELFHPMRRLGNSGMWELFVPGIGEGARYKYRITSGGDGRRLDKADPLAFAAELRPDTASVVCDLSSFDWHDEEWMESRPWRQALDQPMSIYEVHLGSWRRAPDGKGKDRGRWLTYRELADQVVPYVKDMGYTHIELMPVSEHPFDGSWGYQVTGFFAPTSRYGTPDDFRYFVEKAHEAGIGVILDWVPGHFPKDDHGLARFDGTHLYEHSDPRRSENLEWGTLSFNLAREEVAAFLMSSAVFWLEEYHVDGLRVDAVSSMIYLDYSRHHWVPNELGGRENLEAAAFLQQLNTLVHRDFPGVLTIAEESTAWPRVTGRESTDSLGFDLKWNLGWMHDTLGYMQRDPIFRKHHHNGLTFSLVYAFNENFLLPFSHDEVVHGKRSLLSKMPGDEAQQFANLRALYGYMCGHPGKKLHFMGAEFGSRREWNESAELDWGLLQLDPHRKLRAYVRDLNRLYTSHPALHELDFGWEGFQWIACDEADLSIVSFIRRARDARESVVVVANFTPVVRRGYRVGVPAEGAYRELLNSDRSRYGGSGVRNSRAMVADPEPANGQPYSIKLTLPPLGVLFLGFGPA